MTDWYLKLTSLSIPVAVIVGVLLYLHRRSVKNQRREDLNDPHKSLDFGLGQGGATKGSRKSLISREKDGQSRFNRQQMSMDMNLSSPYLLPPELHTSRESFNSLAKTIHQAEDPYRPVAQYAGSDVGSIRSVRRGPDAASIYTRSESRADATPLSPGLYGSPPRQNLPRSPLHPPEPSHMKPEPALVEGPGMFPPTAPPKGPLPAIGTARSASPSGEDEYLAIGTAIQEPPAVAQKSPSKPLPSPSQPSPADSGVGLGYGEMGNPFEKSAANQMETPTEPSIVGLGFSNHPEPQRASIRTSTSSYDSRATSPGPFRGQPASTTAPIIEEPEPLDYYDFDFADMPEIPRDQRSPSPANRNGNLEVDEQRGRNMQRNSHLFEQQNAARQSGLGVPQQDNRRLSVGFRPCRRMRLWRLRTQSTGRTAFARSTRSTLRTPSPRIDRLCLRCLSSSSNRSSSNNTSNILSTSITRATRATTRTTTRATPRMLRILILPATRSSCPILSPCLAGP